MINRIPKKKVRSEKDYKRKSQATIIEQALKVKLHGTALLKKIQMKRKIQMNRKILNHQT